MFSVAIHTFGCKLNQLESEAIAAAFSEAGFSLLLSSGMEMEVKTTGDCTDPDIIIINTCTVTSRADQKARRAIRKALRDHPAACVIVTGCYAELDTAQTAALETDASSVQGSRLFVIAGKNAAANGDAAGQKSALLGLPRFLADAAAGRSGGAEQIPALVRQWLSGSEPVCNTDESDGGIFRFVPANFPFHTRAFLKIQDGCDQRCTYCRARLARGPSVSLKPEQALASLRILEAKGCREVVLTGMNISRYQGNGGGLAELLEYLLAGTDTIALRLSSLEPDGISERFAAVLSSKRIRPHFHLSVQSGSAEVLWRMGRNYSPQAVEHTASLLRAAACNPFLACDIIAGFPGETDGEFAETLALCRTIGFSWIHAFPYSRRPGTPAFSFRPSVNEQAAASRVQALISLAHEGRRSYTESCLGREVEVLVESGRAEQGCRGTSENYLKTLIRCAAPNAPPPGTALRCVLFRPLHGADGCDVEAVESGGDSSFRNGLNSELLP